MVQLAQQKTEQVIAVAPGEKSSIESQTFMDLLAGAQL